MKIKHTKIPLDKTEKVCYNISETKRGVDGKDSKIFYFNSNYNPGQNANLL